MFLLYLTMRQVHFMYLLAGIGLLHLVLCEPVPSKFDFESQLLDKVIRMELKMEQMEARINQTQNNVNSALHSVTLTLDNKTAELKQLEGRLGQPVVAFHAIGPEDQSIDTSQKLILRTAVLNIGDGYDRFLGMFTAPVTGLYLFTTHICTYSNQGFHYNILQEGNIIAKSTKFNTAQYDCGSCSVITEVTSGQRVWIQSSSGNPGTNQLYEDAHRQTSFSGLLLNK